MPLLVHVTNWDGKVVFQMHPLPTEERLDGTLKISTGMGIANHADTLVWLIGRIINGIHAANLP